MKVQGESHHDLRILAVVMLQQSTQTRSALDVFGSDWRLLLVRWLIDAGQYHRRFIAQRLMWSFQMIVGHVLRNQIIHVLLAKDQEVVQTFLAYTLNPSFNEGVLISCSMVSGHHLPRYEPTAGRYRSWRL